MKTIRTGLMAFFGLCLSFAALAADANTVVASGTGFTITKGELDKAYRVYVLTQKLAFNIDVLPAFEQANRARLLEDMIMHKLAALRATATDRATAGKKADDNFKEQQEAFLVKDNFKKRIEATGLTQFEFKQALRAEALAETVAKRELNPLITPRQGEILKFYNDHPDYWRVPETAKVAHVFLSLRDVTGRRLNPDERAAKLALASKVLAKAPTADFKNLVKEYSEDLVTKEKGGEFMMVRGSGNPEVEKQVFALKPNVQAKIVTTEHGYHIVKLLERKAAKVKTVADVTNDIRLKLMNENFVKEFPAYFDRLKKSARVSVADE